MAKVLSFFDSINLNNIEKISIRKIAVKTSVSGCLNPPATVGFHISADAITKELNL